MNLLSYQRFYLVGIKGVAMTALAQCLIDAGKQVQGSDVAENFVTQKILDRLSIHIDIGFTGSIPENTDCVIYTSAHQAQLNPQVIAAKNQDLTVIPQAVGLAELFNAKEGIAVCGVGGKSTTSAMIAWVLEKHAQKNGLPVPSYAVGVGNIPGLDKTGQWSATSKYFVAEADEYVIDPSAPKRGEPIVPRFSFLEPLITVCTNLTFDHPDVYQDFAQTKSVYTSFFNSIKENGSLIINADNTDLLELSNELATSARFVKKNQQLLTFGSEAGVDLQLLRYEAKNGQTESLVFHKQDNQEYRIRLQIPGEYNVMNAMATLLATQEAGITPKETIEYLADFRSTQRRAEFIGKKHDIFFYDDYAHHPNEVAKVIHAFREWFPTNTLVVAFQSHTFSRTKALFPEFVDAFSTADEVCMIDIFASAREAFDATVSSDTLCAAITKKFPNVVAQNYHDLPTLALHLKQHLQPGDVCITVGAGDIYQLHDLLD